MAVKQNSRYLAIQYPLVAEAVTKSFYVIDSLSSADFVSGAVKMQRRLIFEKGV